MIQLSEHFSQTPKASKMSSQTSPTMETEMKDETLGSDTEETLTLVSFFSNNVESFDNDESFPDMKFTISGLEKPLALHKNILGRASQFVNKTLKCKSLTNSEDNHLSQRRLSGWHPVSWFTDRSTQRSTETNKNSEDKDSIEWPFDTNNEVDRDALLKSLRFCYGETVSVGVKGGECCAMIAALFRLQVTCLDEVVGQLTDFAVKQATKEVKNGTQLLKDIQRYPECCESTKFNLEERLVKVVLTANNICESYETVVDNCLMELPEKYLDMTEFGAAHTKYSEFHVRAQYIIKHDEEMETSEKQEILKKCELTELYGRELRELEKLGIIESTTMIQTYQSVLEKMEKQRDAESQRAQKAERAEQQSL